MWPQILSAILLLAILGCNTAVAAPTHTYVTSATDVQLVIDFGNGTTLHFDGLTGMTVLNVTEAAVPVEYEWYGDLVFVTSIAGVSNDPDRDLWWQYWVNGELGPVAANKYILSDGDVVEWRLPSHGIDTSTVQPGTSLTYEDTSLYLGSALVAGWGLFILLIQYGRRKRN